MADEHTDTCPECGSSELVGDEDELVCSDCGLVVADETQSSTASDSDLDDFNEGEPDWRASDSDLDDSKEGEPDWRAFDSDLDDSKEGVPDWRARFQKQREEREQKREKRAQTREEQQVALDAAPPLSISWTVNNRRLIGSINDLAILFDAKTLYAVEVVSGDTVWETRIPDLIGDSSLQDITHLGASYMDSRVILGESELFVRLPTDKILSLSVETGDTQWEYTPAFEHSGRLALTEDSIYLTNDYDAMTALSLNDGSIKWTADSQIETADWQSWFPVSPVIFNDLIISATNSDDGLITARDRHTGEAKWQFAMRETPSVLSSAQGQCLAGTVRGDTYAIDSKTGTQQWRHRITEFGDPEDPSQITRPTEPILGVNQTDSYTVITGGGFYSSVVKPADGSQVFEMPSAGVDAQFGNPESQFYHPASVTRDGRVCTYSHKVIQSYHFEGSDEVSEAQEWAFETTDMIHAKPVLWESEEYLTTIDSRDCVCLLELPTGDPAFTCELEDSAEKFATTQQGILVDTKSATYLLQTQ